MNNLNKQISKKIKQTATYDYFYQDIKHSKENSMLMKNNDNELFIDKVIAYYETQMNNPDAWVSWDELKERLRRLF